MKTIKFIPTFFVLFFISISMFGQQRVLTFYSYCNQIAYAPDNNFHFDYSLINNDSLIIIQGNLGVYNCGATHIFTAVIDSNHIEITQETIDTAQLTCLCYFNVYMCIDSFPYNNAVVVINGNIIVTAPLIKNVQNKHTLKPNPSHDYVTIETNDMEKVTEIKIFDLLGNVKKNLITSNLNELIDISELENGIYILKVGDETMKLIKK